MRRSHPEARAGEVCVGNMFACDFAAVGWATKRMGVAPHDSEGRLLRGGKFRPVFVARAEIETAGVATPDAGVIDHRW